ncbi:NAD(P)/FAD-dependent oxidoreductase [Dendrosporobacter sp. 1207_IL3150]|uniref:NAD(P)/FAD-dependent oxidoreductase n=1 Tax=Dendrosporobacter sp. 1207_IL3150 TaxID=3084054 RepID=UPI002FD8FC2B
MLRITNFRVPIDDNTAMAKLAAKRLNLPPQAVLEVVLVRKALDARRKNNINFVYTLDVKIASPEGQALARLRGDKEVTMVSQAVGQPVAYGNRPLEHRPVVVGLGPAGMLAGLTLANYGYKPLVLERGRDVDRRTQDITNFWRTGKFDEVSNVQFGEGGAGTFSDGKLTTRVNDPRMRDVLDLLVEAGAPPEIKYLHKPHIGTDKLREVVKYIRKSIIEFGGQVEFETMVTDIDVKEGKLKGLMLEDGRYIPCTTALFGIGHSARDTYYMLHKNQVAMQAKPFAIGVRIEHPQELIDRAQYGITAGHPNLSAADYALVYHTKDTGRTAYSFCMCPGGIVVAAASEQGQVVTNGMSYYNRASGIANSALVVNVNPSDYGNSILDGIEFQRKYESLAYQAAGRNYFAPVQTVGDFLAGKSGSESFLVNPSYNPGIAAVDLRQCLPRFVTDTLAEALPDFGRKIRGFDHNDAVMTGVETRTSAPVRIIRNSDFVSENTEGLYPIGEGAGYAGGIMSAALDGLNAALALIGKYRY